MPWSAASALKIDDLQRAELNRLVRARSTPQKIVLRARIVLAAAEGQSNNAIASSLSVSRPTVILWRDRFATHGIEGITHDATRPGRRKAIDPKVIAAVVDKTLSTKPAGSTHWTSRDMADAQGISASAVRRIWKAHGLKPHITQRFKLSSDPRFEEKLRDVVGLYLKPPDKALVLCVDEKTSIQALDRTRPILPLRPGIPERQTHDYKRNGTTDLFAALNTLTGAVIGRCYPHHSHEEFIAFLRVIDRQTSKRFDLHLIVDNAGTHKTSEVKAWLAKHPRFHLHFTPTSSSWLNLVERWFAQITNKRIRRGTFTNVAELIEAINEHITHNNSHPKPFVWSAEADDILRKVARCKEASGAGH
ncbi:MAG: IS630 family transposase [Actinomycetota bacterium]